MSNEEVGNLKAIGATEVFLESLMSFLSDATDVVRRLEQTYTEEEKFLKKKRWFAPEASNEITTVAESAEPGQHS